MLLCIQDFFIIRKRVCVSSRCFLAAFQTAEHGAADITGQRTAQGRQGQGQQNQQSHTPGQKVQQEIPSYGSQSQHQKPESCKH